MRYEDIYVATCFDEAKQFRYKHNDQMVHINTPVAYDALRYDQNGEVSGIEMICLGGIYYDDTDESSSEHEQVIDTPGQTLLNWPGDFDGAHHTSQ